MQRIIRSVTTKRPGSYGRAPRPTASDRARSGELRGSRAALLATSVLLVGPERWRAAVESILAGNTKLAVAADVEGDPREVDIYKIPQAEVVLIAVNGEKPNPAVEFAMRLQAKDRGTGIALVLPNMSMRNLRLFCTYAGSWSLISAAACGDAGRLGAVLESTGRGIPWVDPAVGRLLKSLETGTMDVDEDFDAGAINHLISHPADHPAVALGEVVVKPGDTRAA